MLYGLFYTSLIAFTFSFKAFKWIIFVVLSFVGNGFCSIIQKVQQLNCNGKYKNEFMITALLIAGAVMFIYAIITEKNDMIFNLKKGFKWYAVCGLANGIVNLFVIILSLKMSASVMFPIISAGGIITSLLVALFLYKEKLSKTQYTGLLLGIATVVLLNI